VTEAVVAPPIASTTTVSCPDVPICFLDNKCEAQFGTGFSAYRDSIIGSLTSSQRLQIIGTYSGKETNDSEFENLGLCRANFLKSEFSKYFDASRIDIGGQRTVGQEGTTGYASDRIRFVATGEVQQNIPNSTLIYFPFNSTDKLDDGDVEAYLDSVAERVKTSGESIKLTGHTDDIGSVESNETLGRRRAAIIRDYLVAKGVARAKITVLSRGELDPVATNNTEAGRAQNRRTELQIIN
jgi:outer membrane protein OmpA-like peptidoglycan-associated protein